MKIQKWRILVFLLGLTGTLNVQGQAEKFKAIFIYNFIKDIEWPSNKQGIFQIAVFGDSPIIDELNVIASKKKIGSETIVIKKVSSIAEIGDSKICFIPNFKKKVLPDISSSLKNKNILVITDEASDLFGINFKEINQKLTFQISRSNIEAHGLRVNSTLLSLGIAVN